MPQYPYFPVNTDLGAVVTLSAASASGNSADKTLIGARGVKVVIDVTAITGTTPTLVVDVQGKDTASGQYYTALASASITATGVTVLTVYPGVAATSNESASDHLPATWRISYTIGGTTPAVTATIGACLLV